MEESNCLMYLSACVVLPDPTQLNVNVHSMTVQFIGTRNVVILLKAIFNFHILRNVLYLSKKKIVNTEQ